MTLVMSFALLTRVRASADICNQESHLNTTDTTLSHLTQHIDLHKQTDNYYNLIGTSPCIFKLRNYYYDLTNL